MQSIISWEKYADILYVESYGNYVKVYTSEDDFILLRSSLRSLELQLPSHIFLRIHQRYIINLWKIKDYKGNAQGFFTKLKETNIVLKVSRKYMRVFQDRIARISTPEIVMTRNDPGYLFW